MHTGVTKVVAGFAKSGFLQRRLQSLGTFKQAIGEATFQRFRVRQQYPEVFGTIKSGA
jgi:hypothetical protein